MSADSEFTDIYKGLLLNQADASKVPSAYLLVLVQVMCIHCRSLHVLDSIYNIEARNLSYMVHIAWRSAAQRHAPQHDSSCTGSRGGKYQLTHA